MKKIKLLFLFIAISNALCGQYRLTSDFILAQEYSKETALYQAKFYVINNILNASGEIIKFELDPLTASTSGELTALSYNCEMKSKKGLLLVFYGDYINSEGVNYKGYGFKDLPQDMAIAFLNKISDVLDKNGTYLTSSSDNNVYFQFEDMGILLFNTISPAIRVSWNGFDSFWDISAFRFTKKRFEKRM